MLRRKSPPSAVNTSRYVNPNAAIGVRKIWPNNCPVRPTRAISEPTVARPSMRSSQRGLFSKVALVNGTRCLFLLHNGFGERLRQWIAVGDQQPQGAAEAPVGPRPPEVGAGVRGKDRSARGAGNGLQHPRRRRDTATGLRAAAVHHGLKFHGEVFGPGCGATGEVHLQAREDHPGRGHPQTKTKHGRAPARLAAPKASTRKPTTKLSQ